MNDLLIEALVGVAAFGIAAAIGAASGYRMARAHYEPALQRAEQQVGALQAGAQKLTDQIAQQNEAISAMEVQQEQRAKAASEAIKKAASLSSSAQAQAKAVLLRKAPQGLDACLAARQAVDAELQQERVSK